MIEMEDECNETVDIYEGEAAERRSRHDTSQQEGQRPSHDASGDESRSERKKEINDDNRRENDQ